MTHSDGCCGMSDCCLNGEKYAALLEERDALREANATLRSDLARMHKERDALKSALTDLARERN